jgi:TPR repeat protein
MDTLQERRKDLDKQACRTFVCPNLALMDEKGKELELKDVTIKRAKDMAIEYFKKTYQEPHYSSAKNLLPAFMYMASIIENDRRTQWDVENVYNLVRCPPHSWGGHPIYPRNTCNTFDIEIG